MAETFDPYAEWLGVRTGTAPKHTAPKQPGPPNHYELLRLEPFEANVDAILAAANMQMAKVRGIRPGEHVDDWRRLLDELNAAKRCLCDAAERSQYDAMLRQAGVQAPAKTGAAAMGDSPSSGGTGAAGAAAGPAAGAKKSPYMEFSDSAVSNPLPPGFGSGRSAPSGSPGKIPASGNVGAERSALQPGMNLLPPGRRAGQEAAGGGAIENAPQPPADPPAKAWAPPKAKLAFPGETVPAATPAPPAAPTAPSSGSAATPQSLPTQPLPPQPIAPIGPQAMPQPFGSPMFPGAVQHPGVNAPAAFPQPPAPPNPYPSGPSPVPGMPGFFPRPGAMPGLPAGFPQPGAIPPGFAPPGFAPPGFMPPMPQQPAGLQPPPMYPQTLPPQQFAPQQFAPQQFSPQQFAPQQFPPQPAAPQQAPVGGTNFLDDVLSGPTRGGSSPPDEFGFGGASPAPQAAPDWQSSAAPNWQPGGFPQPASVAGGQSPFEQAPPPAEQPFDPSAPETTSRHRPPARPAKNSQMLLVGGALAAVVLLAGGLIAAIVFKQQQEKPVAVADPTLNKASETSISTSHPGAAHDPLKSPKPAPATQPAKHPAGTMPKNPPTKPATPDHASPKSPQVATTGPKTHEPKPANNPSKKPATLVLQPTPDPAAKPAKPKPPAVDPAKAARLVHLLADVRKKLAERNQDDAMRLVADAKGLAVTPEQVDRVERMNTLAKYVGEFWGAVRDAIGGLKATDEIDVGSTKVVVVEKDEQSLTIHMGSGNRRIGLKEMPSGLAVALANRWLDPKKPENKVFVGAFYAVDPKLLDEEPERAKQLWSEAAAAGVSDGNYLLPLLNPEPAAAAMSGGETGSLASVPSPDAVDRATLKIKGEFDDAIIAATSPTKLAELIQRFFDAADSSDEPARRYALWIQARDTAAKAGRAKLAIDAVDRIAHDFQIDALDMKADAFANNPPTTAEGGREVARAAIALADEAVKAKRGAVASRLAQIAVAAAQVSKGNDLIRRTTQRSKEIEALAGKQMASDPQ